MKKRKNNIWLTIGVIVICVLLLYWLFARTLLVEDEELENAARLLTFWKKEHGSWQDSWS